MMVVSEFKLAITKTINLGNYENVKIEGSVVVGKNSDDDTAELLRNRALDEVKALLEEAESDHVPRTKAKSVRNDD